MKYDIEEILALEIDGKIFCDECFNTDDIYNEDSRVEIITNESRERESDTSVYQCDNCKRFF